MSGYSVEFEAFWSAYPRRLDKKAAYKAFQKAMNEGVLLDKLLQAVAGYKKWLKDGQGWRPEPKHPTTWLNKGCWDDEYEVIEEVEKVSFKISAAIVAKFKLVGMSDHTIKQWFDDAQFINDGRVIVFKSTFIRDHVSRQFDGQLQRAFGYSPELEVARIDKKA